MEGHLVDLDLKAGKGSISSGSSVWSFDLSDVVDGEDRFLIVRNFALKQPVFLSFQLVNSKVSCVAVTKGGLEAICNNPLFNSEPPMFDMQFGSGDTHPITSGDVVVFLVDNRSDLDLAINALVKEESCVGLSVLPGLTAQKSPVITLCVGTGIYVFELSLLCDSDRKLFACFLYGMQSCAKVSFATFENNPFRSLAITWNNLFSTPFGTTNVVPMNSTLADSVEELFGYRMEPVTQLKDSLSFACHFGRAAFHARQIFIHREGKMKVESRRPVSASSSLPTRTHQGGVPLRQVRQPHLHNSLPAGQANTQPAEPVVRRMRKAPHPLAIVPRNEAVSSNNLSLMSDLIEKLKNSKRKAISTPAEDNARTAKQFLQWFDKLPSE